MIEEHILKYVSEFIPSTKLIKKIELKKRIHKFSKRINERDSNELYSIFDWVLLASDGNIKAVAFLRMLNDTIESLLNNFPAHKSNILRKVNEIIKHQQNNPSFYEPFAELLIFHHLSHCNNKAKFLGFDFEIGNGKNVDLAFIENKRITLIEVRNIHNLINNKDSVYKIISDVVTDKLKKKTKDIEKCKDYFKQMCPDLLDVRIYIMIFCWGETKELIDHKNEILQAQEDFKNDLLPICSLLPEYLPNNEFKYSLCSVTEIIERWKEKGMFKENSDSWQSGMAKNITFIVTKDCQLACKYCYLVGKNEKERMSWETAKAAIDYILSHEDEFREESVIWDFIGGEPFMEIDLIDKICDYLKTEMFRMGHHWFNSYRFSFSTNGINYHTPKVQEFIKKNHTHLSIGITIDGTERKHDLNRIYKQSNADGSEHGSYQDVVRNIPLWLEQFPGGATKVTISSADIPYIKESVLHLYSLGIHEVNINCVFEDVWQEGDDKLFEDQLMQLADAIIDDGYYTDYACSFYSENIGKPLDPVLENQNWCGAGKMLAVDAAGLFYPCTRFAGYSLREKKPLIIGNVRDGIDKNKLRPFLTLDRMTQSPDKCKTCEVASGCAWCQGENYDAASTGTVYQRATAICLMHKARVRANNYYWNKLFRKLELEGRREEYEKNKREVKPVDC